MQHSTIIRIRQALIAHGMQHATALFRSYRPCSDPTDFVVFILGKSCRTRGYPQ